MNNIRKNIKRILTEEIEQRKYQLIEKNFDKIFNQLELMLDDEKTVEYYWIQKDNKVVFYRNWWGMLWVADCETYKTLSLYSKIFYGENMTLFHEILLKYLNSKYKNQFGDRLLKGIGADEDCYE